MSTVMQGAAKLDPASAVATAEALNAYRKFMHVGGRSDFTGHDVVRLNEILSLCQQGREEEGLVRGIGATLDENVRASIGRDHRTDRAARMS